MTNYPPVMIKQLPTNFYRLKVKMVMIWDLVIHQTNVATKKGSQAKGILMRAIVVIWEMNMILQMNQANKKIMCTWTLIRHKVMIMKLIQDQLSTILMILKET